MPKTSWRDKLHQGLSRTRSHLGNKLTALLSGKKKLDDACKSALKTLLIEADIGVKTTETILNQLDNESRHSDLSSPDALLVALKKVLLNLLSCCERPHVINRPLHTMMIAGVNGVGKTTSIAKIAHFYQQQQQSILLAAGDTFRAAAIDQLNTWGKRAQIDVIAQKPGADSASVAFDAMQAAHARQKDIMIVDTAGRLHTQPHLMEELKKIKRVMGKQSSEAPHESLLVLDASTGQNAIHQATMFHEAIGLTGIIMTKLDGTARGGVIFALANELALPVRFIGVGEGIDDLRPFSASEFVDAMMEKSTLEL